MNRQDALVSVCLPTYNRAALLSEAIESVRAQTYPHWELIVADNASTDATPEVVASFGDPRIRYVRNERNLGGPPNWERAASEATGRFCAFSGDDDRWDPRLLEYLVPPLVEDPSIDVSFSDHWIIGGDGEVQVETTNAYSRAYGREGLSRGRYQPYLDLALRQQALPPAAAILRLDRMRSVGALDARAGLVLDYYLFARMALAGGAAFYVPERLAYYRVHVAAASAARQGEIWRDMEWVCADLIPRVSDREQGRMLRVRRARAAARRGRFLLRDRKPLPAARAFADALQSAVQSVLQSAFQR